MEYSCICLTSASLTRSRHILEILERIRCCWSHSLSPPSNTKFCRLMFSVRPWEWKARGRNRLGDTLRAWACFLLWFIRQHKSRHRWVNTLLSCKACFLLFVRITDPPVLVNVQLWCRKHLILVLQLMAACVLYSEVGIWVNSPRCSVSAFAMVLVDSIVMLLEHCAWDSFQHL